MQQQQQHRPTASRSMQLAGKWPSSLHLGGGNLGASQNVGGNPASPFPRRNATVVNIGCCCLLLYNPVLGTVGQRITLQVEIMC